MNNHGFRTSSTVVGCGATGKTSGAYKHNRHISAVLLAAGAVADETTPLSDNEIGGRRKNAPSKKIGLPKKERNYGQAKVGEPALVQESSPSSDIHNFFKQFPNKYQLPGGEGPKVSLQIRAEKVGRGVEIAEIHVACFRSADSGHPLETLNGANVPWVSFTQLMIDGYRPKIEGDKGQRQEQLHSYLRGLLVNAGLLEKKMPRLKEAKKEKPYGGATIRPKTTKNPRQELIDAGKLKPAVPAAITAASDNRKAFEKGEIGRYCFAKADEKRATFDIVKKIGKNGEVLAIQFYKVEHGHALCADFSDNPGLHLPHWALDKQRFPENFRGQSLSAMIRMWEHLKGIIK